MSADRLKASTLALGAIVMSAALAGCSGQGFNSPSTPDESMLAPAEKALNTARDAQAEDFAPRTVDAARRRIAAARDILFTAARANRELDDNEQARVTGLVRAARLDAKSALTQTQALAVQAKIAELQGPQDAANSGKNRDAGANPAPAAANAAEGVQ